jgi:membrane fusion protein, copper/silver efflux system
MKKNNAVTIFLLIVVFVAAGVFLLSSRYHFFKWPFTSAQKAAGKQLYYCPMHPNFTSDKPGDCAICGMSLVKKETVETPAMGHTTAKGGEKKIRYYRNPMNPQITSPVPMKDEMGMDYVPVYEEGVSQPHAGVYINPAKQQLIGVKKQKIEMRKLSGQILTVGTVAYDPDLYVAQQEYLQTLKSRHLSGDSNFAYTKQQSEEFINTSKRKLMLMGMSSTEIERLEASGKAEQSLYLPEGDKVWVYMTIYEYEAGFVKEDLPIEVQALAYPGQIFTGKIVSVAPLLESMTRSLKVRALVDNPENKLKLRMYVNVQLTYNLGERLAVPEDAVMHTGTRNIVFIADPNGYFAPKTVKLGAKAQGYYEVLDGLKANEEVVTSGNFLVDSESKLNAVLSQMADVKDTNQ